MNSENTQERKASNSLPLFPEISGPVYLHLPHNELTAVYDMAKERLWNTSQEIKRIRARSEKLGRTEDKRIPALVEYQVMYRNIVMRCLMALEAMEANPNE